jgi:hypothetical protein
LKKIIHINKNIIQYNHKHNLNLPVCRVQFVGGKTRYGSEVEIKGESRMVYKPESPLPCGAKLWIETDADVHILDECDYADIKEMKKNLL